MKKIQFIFAFGALAFLLGFGSCNEIAEKEVLPAGAAGLAGDFRGLITSTFINNLFGDPVVDDHADIHVYNTSDDPQSIILDNVYHVENSTNHLRIRAKFNGSSFSGSGKPLDSIHVSFAFGGKPLGAFKQDSLEYSVKGQVFRRTMPARDSFYYQIILKSKKAASSTFVDTVEFKGLRLTGFPDIDG
jgi:hypothetical protein